MFYDTSFNNDHRLLGRIAIFWGNPEGNYSINDTTRLSTGAAADFAIYQGGVWDFNNDRIDDIVLLNVTGRALDSISGFVPVPKLQVFAGRSKEEWQQTAPPRRADFVWWNPPTIDTLMNHLIDIDCDDQADLVFLGNSEGIGSISTLYGSGSFPDTTAVVTIGYDSIKGMSTLLTDITGDNLVDFIILSDRFTNQRMRVYPGEPGKRLHELISDDPLSAFPRSFRWKQPWAAVPTPFWFDEGWGDVGTILFDGGDGNHDGVNDIWALTGSGSIETLACYGTGGFLDSLIDGQASLNGGLFIKAVYLGIVDGSGIPVTALVYRWLAHQVTGIYYLQWNPTIPQTGRVRTLPHQAGVNRCGGIGGSVPDAHPYPATLQLSETPSPSSVDDVPILIHSSRAIHD